MSFSTKYFFALSIFIFTHISLANPSNESSKALYRDVLMSAKSFNKNISLSQMELKKGELQVRRSFLSLIPSATLTYSWSKSQAESAQQMINSERGGWSGYLNVNLFNASLIYGVATAKKNYEYLKQSHRASKITVLVQASQAYYNASSAHNIFRNFKEIGELLNKALEGTKDPEQRKLIEILANQNTIDVKSAENSFGIFAKTLQNISGFSKDELRQRLDAINDEADQNDPNGDDTKATVISWDEIQKKLLIPKSFEQAWSIALEKSPTLILARQRVDLTEAAKAQALAAYGPTISLSLSQGNTNSNSPLIGPLPGQKDKSIGISVSIPLTPTMIVDHEINKYNVGAAQLSYEKAQQDLKTEMEISYDRINDIGVIWDSYSQNLISAVQNFIDESLKISQGKGDVNTLNLSLSTFKAGQASLIQQLSQVWLTQIEILASNGSLFEVLEIPEN